MDSMASWQRISFQNLRFSDVLLHIGSIALVPCFFLLFLLECGCAKYNNPFKSSPQLIWQLELWRIISGSDDIYLTFGLTPHNWCWSFFNHLGLFRCNGCIQYVRSTRVWIKGYGLKAWLLNIHKIERNAPADIIKRWTWKLAQEKAGNTLEIISVAISSSM
jgi:hypothetical protein